jgi:hypothetical protein
MMKLSGPLVGKTPPQGAATTCYVVTAPEIQGVSGEFFEDCKRLVFAAGHPIKQLSLSNELIRPSIRL